VHLAAGLRQGWDAAFPPASPPNVEFVAGYIGGGTPHVWTETEWAASHSKSTAQLRLPIFVRVPPTTRDPVVEANFSADWAEAHGQPKGSLIALDYETSTVQSYLTAYDRQIVKRGFKCVVYGSRSFVMQLTAPSGGRWSATWNNLPHMDNGAVITQYGGLPSLDLNVAADSVEFWNITGEPAMADFSDEQKATLAAFRDTVNAHNDALYKLLARPSDGRANLADIAGEVVDLAADEDRTQAAIAALQLAGGDPTAIVDAIEALGPEVAQLVNDEFARRQAS